MSYDTLTATVPAPFGKGREITFSYPSGRSADDYRSEGAVLSVGSDNLRQGAESFFVTYGSSSIRVYYNGPYQSSGSVTLKAPLSVEADVLSGSSSSGAVASAIVQPTGSTVSKSVADWLSLVATMLSEDEGSAPQFKILNIIGAVAYWQVQGATNGNGPGFTVAGSATDVDGNLAAKGTGAVVLGNGIGNHLKVGNAGDGGGAPTNLFTISGGTGTNGPKLTSNYDALYDIPDNAKYHYFTVNGAKVLQVGQTGAGAANNWLQVTGSQNDFVRLMANSSANANVGMFIQARGASGFSFWNGNGSMVGFDQSGTGALANNLVLRAGGTGVAPRLFANGSDTDINLELRPKGAGKVDINRIDLTGVAVQTGYHAPTVTEGGNYALDGTKSLVLLQMSGNLTAFTVSLPTAPINGQKVRFAAVATITTLTLTPASGHTVIGNPAGITASSPFALMFISSRNQWVRVG